MGWNKWWFAWNIEKEKLNETTMRKSQLCDDSDAYILAKGTMQLANTARAGAVAEKKEQKRNI